MKETVVLSKSVTPSRITENFSGAVNAFEALTKADIEKLDGLAAAGKQRRFVTHPCCHFAAQAVDPFPQIHHSALAYVLMSVSITQLTNLFFISH